MAVTDPEPTGAISDGGFVTDSELANATAVLNDDSSKK